MGYVSNRPLVEAFKRSELTQGELAARLGYFRRHTGRYERRDGGVSVYRFTVPDNSPVRRALGLSLHSQVVVREATALRYAKALNLDPVDIGL